MIDSFDPLASCTHCRRFTFAPLRRVVGLIPRAVAPGSVEVANVVKVVQLCFVEKEGDGERVHGGISPSLVEEATGLVEIVKVLQVLFAAEETQITDLSRTNQSVCGIVSGRFEHCSHFKVGPKVAEIPLAVLHPIHGVTASITDEVHAASWVDVVRVQLQEFLGGVV